MKQAVPFAPFGFAQEPPFGFAQEPPFGFAQGPDLLMFFALRLRSAVPD